MDALSRLPLKLKHCAESDHLINFLDELPVMDVDVSRETVSDGVLSKVMYYVMHGWPSKVAEDFMPYSKIKNSLTIERNCLLSGFKVIIPPKLKISVLEQLHLNHPGVVKMKALARSFVWWPRIDLDIENYVKGCNNCQFAQKSPCLAPLHSWPITSYLYERIHVDFAEKNSKYYFLVVDSFSKWIDIFPMSAATTNKTIELLRYLMAAYGLPKELVSDNGPQFTSHEFRDFLKCNGVKHTLTPPYHSASNGMIERVVQTFKQNFKKNCDIPDNKKLCNFLFSYRNVPHCSTGVTPSELFLNRRVRTRLSLLQPDPSTKL